MRAVAADLAPAGRRDPEPQRVAEEVAGVVAQGDAERLGELARPVGGQRHALGPPERPHTSTAAGKPCRWHTTLKQWCMP